MRARAAREALRFQAAGMFAQGIDVGQIARQLAVTRKSVNEWKRSWRAGGVQALASKGPGGERCRLDAGQLDALQAALDAGPAAHGWVEDQRWTLARVAVLVGELFGVRYTPRGIGYLLHRIGWSPQVPQHVAAQQDAQAVATWVKETWSQAKRPPPGEAPGSVFRTRPGRICDRPRPAPGPGAE